MFDSDCNKQNFLILILMFVMLFLIIRMKVYTHETDLIKLYKLKKGDTIINNIMIRKQDGDTCSISSNYEDGHKKTVKTGDCL